MTDYQVCTIFSSDVRSVKQAETLLHSEGIKKDKNLDYTCGIYDGENQIIATGSCFANTLRCLAVDKNHQGEGLLNKIVSHLVSYQYAKGNTHLFLYTKCSTEKFFRDLGFYPVVKIDGHLVFMENSRSGFTDYLNRLEKESGFKDDSGKKEDAAAIVMNANPFTKGHLYLIETAAKQHEKLHLFMVSEDASLFPYKIRKKLIIAGTRHLNNIIYHDCGDYIVSNTTFPSYFQKDETDVIEGHARLDTAIFVKIASRLSITHRYAGEEPFSLVTGLYNGIMGEELPKAGISFHIIPRLEAGGTVISASTVREAIRSGNRRVLEEMLPQTTLDFLAGEEAVPVIKHIREQDSVVHY